MCKLSRVLVMLLMLSAASSTAFAQHPTSCINELTPAEVNARIQLIDSHLQANKRRARAHWYGFITLFGALGIYSLVVATQAEERVDRFSNYLGAAGAFLASAHMVVIPNTAAIIPQRFRRLSDATPEDRRLKLRVGLGMMERASRRAELASGLSAQIVPLVWSATWSTVIMRKFDSPLTVLRMVGGGLFFTEMRTFLTPRDSVRSWERLRGSFCGGRYLHRYSPMEIDELLPAETDEPVDEYDDYEDEYDESDAAPDEPETVTTGGVSFTGAYFLHTF